MYKLVLLLALAICAQAHGAVLKNEGRVANGTPASPGQVPYQAFLLITNLEGQTFACGGSLISKDWVLTSGRCISGFISAEVFLGSITWEESPVIMKTTNLVIHPNYASLGLKNDIGLVGLPKSAPLSDNIKPIEMAVDPSETYSGREGMVSGFGITVNGGQISPTLNVAPVRVISNLICTTSYPLNIRDSVLCTRGVATNDQGFCDGDIGGPLVVVESGTIRQIGVASFGSSKGCNSKDPKGYSRPYHYLRWITVVTGIVFDSEL